LNQRLRTLAIDTSSAACSVALFDGALLIEHRHDEMGRGHAELLLPMIAALADGGRADQICVGCGPGSFTGLRVGIAAARGLAIGWGVPVSGFGSLALVAAGAGTGAPLLVVMEGGHGEWFVQRFAADGSAVAAAMSQPPEAAITDPTSRVAGSRAEAFVAQRGFGTAIAALPDARHALALTAAEAGWPASPVYARAPDAAVKRG
jgi:tRNA threonylcarbamoyladenosine biosynthesis protein TsaB